MQHVYIIAEIGVNHNGSLQTAMKMLDTAAALGVDCVKFQAFKAEALASKYADTAEYHKKNVNRNENNQQEMLKRYELQKEDFIKLKNRCKELNVDFLCTPFDNESIELLEELNVKLWKIPSGEITNVPYLINIAKTGKPVVLSTGMSTMEEILYAVDLLKKYGTTNITLLHCNTEYPTPYEDVNLKAMETIHKETGLPVGYSDHTPGIAVSLGAVALGACVIEKHFTLDKNMPGPDHKASMEPDEMRELVSGIRILEKALGNNEKKVTDSERKNIEIARKSIIALRDIPKGEVLSENNITTKRPGSGISPIHWFEVLGTKAIKDFKRDECIEV